MYACGEESLGTRPLFSIFIATCSLTTTETNAVYCTQHSYVVIILYIYMYMYVYTYPTSVHVTHTVHVYLNIKVEFTVVSCHILFFTCPLLSSHL